MRDSLNREQRKKRERYNPTRRQGAKEVLPESGTNQEPDLRSHFANLAERAVSAYG